MTKYLWMFIFITNILFGRPDPIVMESLPQADYQLTFNEVLETIEASFPICSATEQSREAIHISNNEKDVDIFTILHITVIALRSIDIIVDTKLHSVFTEEGQKASQNIETTDNVQSERQYTGNCRGMIEASIQYLRENPPENAGRWAFKARTSDNSFSLIPVGHQ